MTASSWIIPAILFGLGILIGYFAKREKHYTDLEEGITYYQDTSDSIFYLRKEGKSTYHVYFLNSDRLITHSASGKADYLFRINKKGDRYYLTVVE